MSELILYSDNSREQVHSIFASHEVNSLPLHIEYGLTRKGNDLGPVVEGLNTWGNKWLSPAKSRGKR